METIGKFLSIVLKHRYVTTVQRGKSGEERQYILLCVYEKLPLLSTRLQALPTSPSTSHSISPNNPLPPSVSLATTQSASSASGSAMITRSKTQGNSPKIERGCELRGTGKTALVGRGRENRNPSVIQSTPLPPKKEDDEMLLAKGTCISSP